MSKNDKKQRESNYLIEYLQHIYIVDQIIGMELFNLNKSLLEASYEKETK